MEDHGGENGLEENGLEVELLDEHVLEREYTLMD